VRRLNSLGKQLVNPWLLEILACPVCKSDVRLEDEKLKCINDRCELKFPVINGIPIMLPLRLSGDLKLTKEKWNEEYQKFYPLEKIDLQHDLELHDAYIHVKKYMKSVSGLFLEVGCGCSRLSCMLAKEGIKTIGIDISLTALKIGKELFERENTNGLFVCGDIRMLPFRDNSFSFMYAGGVIEHFKDTRKAVNELFRCLTPNGFITANCALHIA